ncbi:MAG: FAD-binding oxidoreductase [Gemmatimonadales bacterium]|nr:FAD-binding oxidoreductase [Gemmatimonadales bacterium]
MSLSAPPRFRGVFRTDELARAVYSEAAGVARIVPAAVAVPADADDLVTLVRWAAASRVSLVPRGSGSSMANGALGEGVIVDLARFDHVGSVERGASEAAGTAAEAAPATITVGAAVTRDRVQAVVREHGLTFPIDPSSSAFATIGGLCATHAAGARTVKHGPLRAWITGLDCVFADGTRAWLRRTGRGAPGGVDGATGAASATDPATVRALQRFDVHVAPRVLAARREHLRHEGVRKESSGYALDAWLDSRDPIDLILGSEGTLAFIVGVELRLTRLPAATASLLAGFPDLEGAASAAGRLAASGASAVELLDRTFLEIAASEGSPLPLPEGLEAVLVVESEGTSSDRLERQVDELAGICETGGATHVELALGADGEARIWALRHAASPILNRLAPRLQSMQLIEDGCVPPPKFAEYVRGVRAALDRAAFRGVIFGHAGDAHAHVNALVDVAEPDWRARAERLVEEVTALVARFGGTLAGEHGDGRLRTPLLAHTWPAEALELFAATKRAFDPEGILNPGVKVPLPGAAPLADLKYDPALPPLPTAARAALDRIVREKAWSHHRLDLVGEV